MAEIVDLWKLERKLENEIMKAAMAESVDDRTAAEAGAEYLRRLIRRLQIREN